MNASFATFRVSLITVLALGLVPACGANAAKSVDAGSNSGVIDANSSERPDATVVDPLLGAGAVELVATGYQFTEGPQWRESSADLLFSDIPANRIYRYSPGGGEPVVHREPSGNANGLAIDSEGRLLAAEHGSRSLTRDGVSLVGEFEGARLNSPNDVVADQDGTIYFTDPPYGISDDQRELDFMGIYRLETDGSLFAEYQGALSERPNGIGMSPNRQHVYVADTSDGNLYRFDVGTGGALVGRIVFATTSGGADGLAIDAAGNIFVTANDGVEVYRPDGSKWGTIEVPEKPANCAFGDADHRTLYITARTSLYRVRLREAGLPLN